jgi:hypothetical protein
MNQSGEQKTRQSAAKALKKTGNKKGKIMRNDTNNASDIVSKVWSFCNVLRNDGVSYGD